MENNKNTTSTGSGQGKESLSQQANAAKEAVKNTVSQQASTAKEAVKSTVADTAATVKEQTRQAVNEAQQTVTELAADAKQTATEKIGEARAQAESMVDERKNQTADRLQGIAGALRETSNKLQDQEEGTIANYAATAADQVDKFSSYLRDQNVGDLLHDVEGFARRQPEIFLAGALAAGFLLGRFFKSSNQGNQMQRYGYYPRYGQTSESVYGTSAQQSQYGAQGYGRSYDANTYGQPNYSQPYGSQPGQYDAGGSGQYGSAEYQGRQGSSDPQYGRPNQRDWSSTTEGTDQSNSGLASTYTGPNTTEAENSQYTGGTQTASSSSSSAKSESKEK